MKGKQGKETERTRRDRMGVGGERREENRNKEKGKKRVLKGWKRRIGKRDRK